jgi:hypothetical protein
VRQRLTVLFAVLALIGTGSALAFDCIRVSASAKGLQQSTKSGNWALFDLSSGPALQQSLAALGEEVTSEQAACASAAYKAAGDDLPLHFALGFGVAGRNGVLPTTTRTSRCSAISRASTTSRPARSALRSSEPPSSAASRSTRNNER